MDIQKAACSTIARLYLFNLLKACVSSLESCVKLVNWKIHEKKNGLSIGQLFSQIRFTQTAVEVVGEAVIRRMEGKKAVRKEEVRREEVRRKGRSPWVIFSFCLPGYPC